MKKNGESIYATKASPFPPVTWGRTTQKQNKANTILYLSVFDWPKDGKLVIPAGNEIISAKLLANGKSVRAERKPEGIEFKLPETAPDPIASVIKLELKGKIESQGIKGQ